LLGLIAGSLSTSDRIGYIADYPIYSTMSNINAFALGAKMANPRARIQLTWSSLKGEELPEERIDPDIHFISDKDFIVPEHPDRRFGLYVRMGEEPRSVATAVCHWGKFYEQIIEGIRGDSWTMDTYANRNRAINYWWGMSAGVTELICSGKLPGETRRLVEFLTETIKSGQFFPFDTELIDNTGEVRHAAGEHLRHTQIAKMDWLLDNVDGKIPAFHELKEEALSLVLQQGNLAQDSADDSTGEIKE
jgi:hypothetical protein